MKKLFKRLLSAILTILIFIGSIPVEAQAIDSVKSDMNAESVSENTDRISLLYEYVVDADGNLSITAYNGNELIVRIPESIDGMDVKTIGSYAFSGSEIVDVTLPDGVEEISGGAFANCLDLRSITIPRSAKNIDVSAFVGSDSAVILCHSKSDACDFAIENGFNHIELDDTIDVFDEGSLSDNVYWHLNNYTGHLTVYGRGVMPDFAVDNQNPWFTHSDKIKSVLIAEGIVSIGDNAFSSCSRLTEVIMSDDVYVIGESAFSSCTALKHIVFSENIEQIEDYAFIGCSSLKTELPKNLKTIGEAAFFYCTSLDGLVIPDSVLAIGDWCFAYCTGVTNLEIGAGLTVLNMEAFLDCKNLETVFIGNGVERINAGVFEGCSKIAIVSFSDNVSLIDKSALNGCSKIEKVYFGGSEVSFSNLTASLENTNIYFSDVLYDADGLDKAVYDINIDFSDDNTRVISWPKHLNNGVVKYTVTANGEEVFASDKCVYIDDCEPREDVVYVVNAVTNDGQKTPDAVLNVVFPKKIVNVVAVGDYSEIRLSWSQSSEVISDKYYIYRSVDDSQNFELIKVLDGRSQLTYVDNDIQEGKKYYYYVITENQYGWTSLPSDYAVATMAIDTENPQVTKFTPTTNSYISGVKNISVNAVDNLMVASVKFYYSLDDGLNWNFVSEDKAKPYSISFNSKEFDDGIIKFKAVAYDARENESDPLICAYAIDNTGPEKVVGLTAKEVYTSQLTLEWDDVAADDAACFILQRKEGTSYITISNTITYRGYNLSGLKENTEYTYRVAAIDVHGNIGEYSDDFTVKTLSDMTPPVVTEMLPGPNRYNNKISFRVSAGDDCAVRYISIQVSKDKVTWETIKVAEFSSYKKTVTYTYDISLADYSEGSIFVRGVATDYSNNVSDTSENAGFVEYFIDKSAPDDPRDIVAGGGDGWIYVSWLQGSEEDLSTYSLYRSTQPDGPYQLIASNLKTVSYYDTSVKRNQLYYYKLRVTDTAGNISDFSEAVCAKVADDVTPPEIITVNPGNGSLIGPAYNTVETLVKDNNCIDSIVIEYKVNGAEYNIIAEFTGINKYYTTVYAKLPISDLLDGDMVCVRVRATDICGLESEYSTEYKYTIDKTAPSLYDLNVVVDKDNAKISWKDGADNDISGYKVYRMSSDGTYRYLGSRAKSSKSTYTFYDNLLNLGTGDYVYKIEAYDTVGNFKSYITEPIYYELVKPNKAPVAKINGFTVMEVGVEEYFDAGYSTDDSGIASYSWDFGDGTESQEIRTVKKYETPGKYTVTLTVVDSDGLETTSSMTVTVKDRSSVGTVKVAVVDENGNPVRNAPVYFDLGSENQKVVYANNSGVASMLMENGEYEIGVYLNGYLPAQKTVKVLPNATRTVTITIIKQSIVSGEFEVTRMTFKEIQAAGIDVYDPANQNVYTVNVTIKYGDASVPVTYIRNDSKILTYKVHDSGGEATGNEIKPINRKISGITYIPNPAKAEAIAVLDIPVSASYTKEFFDVKLHIINNATSDFVIVNNHVHLNVPNGMTLMKNLSNGYAESEDVTFGALKGQETKTLNWILRGDVEGSYHLSADYSAVLDKFNADVTATFNTKEPIKVYGLSAVKLHVEVNDEIKYNAFYFNFGIENISDIDVHNPILDFDGLVSNITASTVQKIQGIENSADADFDVVSSLLNVRIAYGDGSEQYIPFDWNDNGTVKIDVDTLSPGDAIYYEYVAYNAVNYDDILYFKDASKEVLGGYSDNVEVKSVSMDLFSFKDAGNKLLDSYDIDAIDKALNEVDNSSLDYAKSFTYFAKYKSGATDNPISNGFLYDDSFFAQSATDGVNPGLALASINIASAAYAGADEVEKLLGEKGLGFNDLDADYSRTPTVDDNDFVAYTFGTKPILVNDSNYRLIVVDIRGTTADLAWLSNVNIGESGTDHLGFKLAAEELYAKLETYCSKMKVNSSNTKFWITGHSRGAAVANIIAEKLSKEERFATKENIYAYTFATPYTSTSADTSLKNIYNFCNIDDFVTMIPLQKWGFKKAGTTIDFTLGDDARTAFNIMNSTEYKGTDKVSRITSDLALIAPDVKTYYSSGVNELIEELAKMLAKEKTDLDLIAYYTKMAALDKPVGFVNLVNDILNVLMTHGTSFVSHAHCSEAYIAYLESIYSQESILASIKKHNGDVIEKFGVDRSNALSYILNDSNFMYMVNSNISDMISEYYYKELSLLLTLDFDVITKEDQKNIVKELILEMLTDQHLYNNIDDAVDDQYVKAVKNVLGVIKDTTSVDGDDKKGLVSTIDGILDSGETLNSLANTLKHEGDSGLKNELGLRLATSVVSAGALAKLNDLIGKSCDYSDETSALFKGISGVSKMGGHVIEFVVQNSIDAINRTEYAQYINSVINLVACRSEAKLILDTIILSYSKKDAMIDLIEGIIANTNPIRKLLYAGKTDIQKIVVNSAKELKDEIDKEFDAETEMVNNILKETFKSGSKILINKGIKKLLGKANVWYALVGTVFELVDKALGLEDKYKQMDTFNTAAYLSNTMQIGFVQRVSAYMSNNVAHLNSVVGTEYSSDNMEPLVNDTMCLLKAVVNLRLTGERAVKKYIDANNSSLVQGDSDYDALAVKKGNIKFGTAFDTSKDLFDYIYSNILKARDIIFNLEYVSEVTKPEAPTVTFDYALNSTREAFDSSYEYCLSDGEWKSCDGRPICVIPATHATTLRVRKASGAGTVAGEITTVTIFAKRDLSKTISVKFDEGIYYFSNLVSAYDYEICFLNDGAAVPDWSSSVKINGSADAVLKNLYSPYIAIRACANPELRETVSNYRIIYVQVKEKLWIDVWGNGSVEQTSETSSYFVGEDIYLNAVPYNSAEFSGWFIDGEKVSSYEEYILEMYRGAEIVARFSGGDEVEASDVEIYSYDELNQNTMGTASLAESDTVAYVGNNMKLYAKVYPTNAIDKTVTWSSSDESIATVDVRGNVTFIDSGEVSIIATLKNGVSASFVVTVIKNEIDSIVISKLPDKLIYTDSEELNLNGLEVSVKYTDGTYEEVSDYSVSGYSAQVGKHTITVSYLGVNVDFEVEVTHNCAWILERESTCSESGVYVYCCKNCNARFDTRPIEKLSHSYEWKITKPATETTSGVQSEVCTVCGHIGQVKELSWCNHNYEQKVVAPTCIEAGYTEQKCLKCNETNIINEVEPLGHSYVEKVVVPSCEIVGYTMHTCERCEDNYVSDYTDALSHDYVETVVEASCSQYGGTIHRCRNCGDEYLTDQVEKLHHRYTEHKIEATCDTGGHTKYICTVCSDEYMVDVTSALGHSIVTEDFVGDCSEGSYTINSCIRCDYSYKTNVVPAKNHQFGEWTVQIPSTETTPGEKVRTCADCGKKETEEIPVIEHTHSLGDWIVQREATCLSGGLKVQKCTLCNEVVNYEHTQALGHAYEWVVTKEPTEEAEGERVKKCTRCGDESEKETVLPTGNMLQISDSDEAIIDYDNHIIYGFTGEVNDIEKIVSSKNGYSVVTDSDGKIYTGATVSVVDSNGKPFESYKMVVFGDVTCDGMYNGQDAVYASMFVNGMLTEADVDEAVFLAADCDRDGEITEFDVQQLSDSGLFLREVKQKYLETMKFTYNVLDNGNAEITGIEESRKSIYIPDYIEGYKVESIVGAFFDDRVVEEVEIAYGVTSIGEDAFDYCYNLSSVIIPDSVITIGSYAFFACHNLKSLIIPDSVTSINAYAITHCGITDISLGNGVKSIGNYAFLNCGSLQSITIPASVESIGAGAFDIEGGSLLSITVDPENQNYSSDEYGVLFDKQKTKLIQYPMGNPGTDYTIPDSVTQIGACAFMWCQNLINIVVPDSVTEIEGNSFADCYNLTSITIGKGIEYIDSCTFSNCDDLEIVYYNGTATEWNKISIGEGNEVLINAEIIFLGEEKTVIDSGKCGDNLTWTLYDDGELVIDGTGEMWNYSYDDNTPPWNSHDTIIKSAVVGDGVTSIGDFAFCGCSSLTSVTIGNDVTSIGDDAFAVCTSLTDVTFGKNITSIGVEAFYNCDSLVCITIPDSVTSISWNAFQSCNSLTSITIGDGVTSIGEHAFDTCTSLTSITIPDSVIEIERNSFIDCYNLTSITIGKGVKRIDSWTFSDCYNLRIVYYNGTETEWNAIDIEESGNEDLLNAEIIFLIDSGECGDNLTWTLYDDGVLIINGTGDMYNYDGDAPWGGYYNEITEVIIGDEVTSIGEYAFAWLNFSKITIGDSVTSIGVGAFEACCALESVFIPASVTNINDTFYMCENLKSITVSEDNEVYSSDEYGVLFNKDKTELVKFTIGNKNTHYTIPDSVERIKEYAFRNCYNLTSITIPDSVTSIGNYAFSGCESLTSITIPDSVTRVGNYAFSGCESLTSITIPDSVTSIGDGAFSYCTNLEIVYYNGTEAEWNDIVIEESGNEDLLNAEIIFLIDSGECGDNLTWTLYDDGELVIDGTGEMWDYTFDDNTPPWNSHDTIIKSAVVGDGVTSIGDFAFCGCSSLTSVMVGNDVTSIGDDAFALCRSLTSITIPDGVTIIEDETFYDCGSLISITIPDGITSIGYSMFSCCSSLTSVTIPNSVTNIGMWAFNNCTSLTSMTIPDSVTSIDCGAFSGCTNLETVYYNGTEAEWNEITVGEENEPLLNAEIIFFVDSGECGDNLTWTLYDDGELVIDGTGDMWNYSYDNNTPPWNSHDTIIKSAVVGDGVTSIGDFAFCGCSSLTSVTIGNDVTSIGDDAFALCANLTDVTFGKNITSIGGEAFYNCDSLVCITIPDSVTIISGGAFMSCDSLTSVTFGESVTSIGDYAFSNCFSLTDVTIPRSVTDFGLSAFDGCGSLNNVVIPDTITNLDHAFGECGTIGSITIPSSVESMVGAFWDSSVNTVYFEGTEDEWYSLLMTGTTECNIFWNELYCNGKKCEAVYYIDNEEASAYYTHSEVTDVIIPSTIGGIEVTRVSFYQCTNLNSVIIPDTVTNLDYAFGECGTIGSVTIPKSVTSMNYICGDYDTHVTEVYYEGTEDEWYSLMMKESDYMDVFYDKLYCNGKLCDASYYIYDGNAEAYYSQSEATEIVVPSTIGGYPVTRVSFYECRNLANVVIPDGVTNLDGAFYNCGTIGKLTIPKSVTSMNYICGDYDTHMTEVYYEGTEDEWYSLMMKESDYMDIFYDKLYCNGKLCEASYYIYDGKAEAYYNQSEATEIVIPASIGGYPITGVSLYQCRNLEMLYISEGITTIDSLSIGDCPLLDAIYIPASVENIPPSAFTYLDPTITIVIDENNNYYKSVDGIVFNKTMTELIHFPSNYEAQSYVVPETVTTIAESAFNGCDRLTEIVLPDNLTSIGDSAFSGCSSLTSIEIPDGVTTIGDSTFSNCSSLTSVALPENLTKIGSYAFYQCEVLSSITLPEGLTTIGTSAFEGCESLTSITIPASVSSMGTTVFSRCNSLANIYVSAGNTSYSSADGIIYNADKTTLIMCAGGKSGAVSVQSTVSTIAERAFYECTQITSITLPSSLRTIEKYAFSRSGIETIVIPEGVTSIGGDAFANCPNLVSASIPGTVTEMGTWLFWSCDELKTVTLGEGITKISSNMFYDCPKLTEITIPKSVNVIESSTFEDCSSLEQIVIPSGVTEIDSYVFSGCTSLTTVEIPNTVTKIDYYAFEDCTALKSVYIPSSVTEISSSAFRDTTVTIRCDSGSKAYEFAVKNGLPYEIV